MKNGYTQTGKRANWKKKFNTHRLIFLDWQTEKFNARVHAYKLSESFFFPVYVFVTVFSSTKQILNIKQTSHLKLHHVIQHSNQHTTCYEQLPDMSTHKYNHVLNQQG